MEKVVRKFESWQAADDADFEYYAQLSGNEKLHILLELIRANNPRDDGTMQQVTRVYPLVAGEQSSPVR
jgi:hypothetical protein